MNEYRLRQKHKKSSLEVEQWTIYSIADLLVATIIVVVAMCDAEPPRFRHFQRQAVQPNNPESGPYAPAGYRPSGAQFTLPQKEYGAPAQGYGPPATTDTQPQPTTTELPETTTTTDEEVTTIEPQAENIKLENLQNSNRPVFLVVPQRLQTQPIKPIKPIKSQSYVTYEYPEVSEVNVEPEVLDASEELVYEPGFGVYSSKLQTIPVGSFYNPYAYFQIYQ